MKKSKTVRSCRCLSRMQKHLAKEDLAITCAVSFEGRAVPLLRLDRTKPRAWGDRRPAMALACTFCPFCGKELVQ